MSVPRSADKGLEAPLCRPPAVCIHAEPSAANGQQRENPEAHQHQRRKRSPPRRPVVRLIRKRAFRSGHPSQCTAARCQVESQSQRAAASSFLAHRTRSRRIMDRGCRSVRRRMWWSRDASTDTRSVGPALRERAEEGKWKVDQGGDDGAWLHLGLRAAFGQHASCAPSGRTA